MSDYEFELPYPPSVNGMWKPFRNRIILTKRGRDYRSQAIEKMKGLDLYGESIDSNVSMSVTLNPPTLRRYDVDNYSKAILDSLTHAKFWIDDEQVQSLCVTKGEKVVGGNVQIKINIVT